MTNHVLVYIFLMTELNFFFLKSDTILLQNCSVDKIFLGFLGELESLGLSGCPEYRFVRNLISFILTHPLLSTPDRPFLTCTLLWKKLLYLILYLIPSICYSLQM